MTAARMYTAPLACQECGVLRIFFGMSLLTIVCALGFTGDTSAFLPGAIAPMMFLQSLIYLLSSLSVAVFLYVFYRTHS
jgi:hypothetical protein